MEANRKRVQVHMLPTDKTGNSCQPLSAYSKPVTRGGLISASGMEAKRLVELGSRQAYHLYFTTDEKIKEGDKVYHTELKIVGTLGKFDRKNDYSSYYHIDNLGRYASVKLRKIIATTDSKLTVKYDNGVRDFGWETKSISYKKLPQPTQALIKAYCEQGGFDWVDVEYEVKGTIGKKLGDNALYHGLKVDPIHGTITTHRIVEKMYSREEVIKISEYVRVGHGSTPNVRTKDLIDEYLQIKENL